VDLKARKRIATLSGRVAAWERRKIKLWEEPDHKLGTDDVRGGCCSFWAEWLYAAARTPADSNPQPMISRQLIRLAK